MDKFPESPELLKLMQEETGNHTRSVTSEEIESVIEKLPTK